MSSFTETPGSFTKGNGPCDPPAIPAGGSIKSYTQLIEAYENLTSMLATHVASALPNEGADPHQAKEYVAAMLNTKQDKLTFDTVPVAQSTNPVTSGGVKQALDAGLAGKQDLLTFDDSPTKGSGNPVSSAGVYNAINTVMSLLEMYQRALSFDDQPTAGSDNPVTSAGIYTAIKAVTDALTAFTNHFNVTGDVVTAKHVLGAVEYLLGALHAKKVIDFVDWSTFSAAFAGINTSEDTDTSGAYVLGMLSSNWETGPLDNYKSKSGRAIIKHVNTFPLDAIVDFTVTYDGTKYVGNITANVSHAENSWEDLTFHLVEGTSAEGVKNVYLCVSSSSFAYHPEEYPAMFRACGINFIPTNEDDYVIPNNIGDSSQMAICSTTMYDIATGTSIGKLITTTVYVNKMFSTTGELAFEVLPDGTVKFAKPFKIGEEDAVIATTADIDAAIPIGAVLRWPGAPDTVPENFHLCDGSQLTKTEQLEKVANIIGYAGDKITLPVEDCAIIRLY